MWISYSDSEVGRFHPVCEKALNIALKLANKEKKYRILHHQSTGSLEMDFVIQNISTGKYLCVIEVKRTPNDVHSTRYQYQAMSYVQMNVGQSEKPYYILTNLEYALAYRFEESKPKAFQQMLKPGLTKIGDFDFDDEEEFIRKLSNYFKDRLNEFSLNNYEYLLTLEEFASHMEGIKGIPRRWKSHLAILLYEYIRGSFSFLNRNDLPDIRLFRNDVKSICTQASRVNFEAIFTFSETTFEKYVNIENSMLSSLFDFGNQNLTGDSVSGILHQIVSAGHEHEGEVPTDLELGRLVAELAKYISGDLTDDDILSDPAAGSGNLITTAIDTYGLKPSQILVNDVNSKLLELLSLRLGLNYARTISKANSPIIINENIINLSRNNFQNVKVIVMNPPFVAGINCVGRKQKFFRRIEEITGRSAITSIGQMPLEAVFLELISLLVEPGTTISCVFPKTHLMARGTEAQVIRRLLITHLGLKVVFTYPGEELFNDVTKDTCILVGKAMHRSESMDIISSYEKIPNLDINRFARSLTSKLNPNFSPLMPGVVAKRVLNRELNDELRDGWRLLNSEMVEAISFIKEFFIGSTRIKELSSFGFRIKRGQAGNNGGSDIMFFNARNDLYNQFKKRNVVLCAGMRNAILDTINIKDGDSKFLNVASNDETLIDEIINAYNALDERGGRQQRLRKDNNEWKNILIKESRGVIEKNSVLIPRAIRATGRVYLTDRPIFVSTNFVVCSLTSYNKALMLATWMTTVFYQLICEISSKDQEGMRKMEVGDIEATLVPNLETVSDSTIRRLVNEIDSITFLILNEPEVRNIDKIWAEELFGDRSEEVLSKALQMLGYLANRRNP